jgi:hypothetical protein
MLGVCLLWIFCPSPASASPWAEVGDSQLRSDIEVLASAGVIDNITTQWPIPWAGILYRLDRAGALDGQPDYVRAAAARVHDEGYAQAGTGRLHAAVTADATNDPSVVRGFDAMGRQYEQGAVSAEYMWPSTAARISVGGQSLDSRDHQTLMLDNSYIAQRVGDAVINAGYLTQWWGPGWISAMSLSNNARPFPQIGITRGDTAPFESPWLHWLGPWQGEIFVGDLDGPRMATNTLLVGTRASISPFSGFEFGLARMTMMCGSGHSCDPATDFFDVKNTDRYPDKVKNQANIDLRYTHRIFATSLAVYMQLMNSDGPNPFVHSSTSHLYGGSLWFNLGADTARLTLEYANSIASNDLFWGKNQYGVTYNSVNYPDGVQYRNRNLGFSLGDDSRLETVQFSVVTPRNITYTFTFDRALIMSSFTPVGANIVTTKPVIINFGEARITVPFKAVNVDLAVRAQSDRPRPNQGFEAGSELAIRYSF